MNRIFQVVFFSLVFFFSSTQAQHKIISATFSDAAVLQYEKAEWALRVEAAFDNPYLQEEVAVNMLLETPSGKELVLPCYFESGKSGAVSSWKARFLPRESGNYGYVFQLWEKGRLAHETQRGSFTSKKSGGKGILHNGDKWTFRFDNGEAFRGIGENICWESRANDDSRFFKKLHEKPKYNYEYMLPRLAANGGNYFRTWICSWNLPLDWKSGVNSHRYENSDEYYHPEAIRKMDRLVELSDSLGLYIMLTMGPGTYDERHDRYETSTREFFTDPKARAQYKNRLRFLVARWGYSPAIGAWEFFNEIDNVQFRDSNNPIPSESIVQWHDEMSAYLKQIDPFEHLVTTSISHRDLAGLNTLGAIDFNQKHIYKHNRALPTTIVQYAVDFDKPYVIGEFGYEYDWQKNFNNFAEEMDSDYKRGLWYGLFSPTPVLPLSWWWEFFEDRGTDIYIARVRAIQDEMMAAGKGQFDSVSVTVIGDAVETFAVRCGKKTFLYVYNASDQPKTSGFSMDAGTHRKGTGRIYDCETGTFTALKSVVNGKRVQLNNITIDPETDKVFILEK